jgi:hypothetical protein
MLDRCLTGPAVMEQNGRSLSHQCFNLRLKNPIVKPELAQTRTRREGLSSHLLPHLSTLTTNGPCLATQCEELLCQ